MIVRLTAMWVSAMSGLLLLAGPANAQDTVSFPSRTVIGRIDTTQKDFSDATLTTTNVTQVGAGSSGSRAVDFLTSPAQISQTASASGAVSLTGVNSVPGEFQAVVNATGAGSFAVETLYPAGSDPGDPGPLYRFVGKNDFYVPFVNSTLPVLNVYLPIVGAGLVDQDGLFTIGVSINGDYSTTSGLDSGSGQHFLANLDEAWTITEDFVYDPVAGRTSFTAVNRSYQYFEGDPYNGQSPFLDVYFFGSASAAPEPATWLSMILGFAMAGAALRRRPAMRLA